MSTPILPAILLLSLSFSPLAGIPLDVTAAAEEAAAAVAQVPAANQTLLAKSVELAQKLSDGASTAKATASAAASLPFAGGMAKEALTKATATAGDAEGLLGGLKNLAAGKPAPEGSIMTQVAGGTANLGDKFKGLPGADALQSLIGQPEIATALTKNLPVDKVPGYEAVQQTLKKLGS